MEEVLILGGVRLPSGKFGGALSGFKVTELGAMVIQEALRRTGVEPEQVNFVAMGNVLQAGVGQNPARQAALGAGLPPRVPAFTVNMVCGSGLKAVNLAAQMLRAGAGEVAVAGGMECMSRVPYYAPDARWGKRLGHTDLVDGILADGLEDAYSGWHMGYTAELVAEKYGVTREEMDRYALQSHQKAARAWDQGAFQAEVLPVEITDKKKGKWILQEDETIRRDTSMEKLARLKPAFKEGGLVTAGNSPGINDGAAAVVLCTARFAEAHGLKAMARWVEAAEGGVEPQWVLMAPAEAYRNMEKKTGYRWEDYDFIEINEAFAAQMVALIRKLEIPEERLNVHGGAIALGHPIGASGARILVTLIHMLQRYQKRRGFAALCLGGGNAVAAVVERVD